MGKSFLYPLPQVCPRLNAFLLTVLHAGHEHHAHGAMGFFQQGTETGVLLAQSRKFPVPRNEGTGDIVVYAHANPSRSAGFTARGTA